MLRLTKPSSVTPCIKILREKLSMQRKDANKNETSNLRMCTVYTRILGGSCVAYHNGMSLPELRMLLWRFWHVQRARREQRNQTTG